MYVAHIYGYFVYVVLCTDKQCFHEIPTHRRCSAIKLQGADNPLPYWYGRYHHHTTIHYHRFKISGGLHSNCYGDETTRGVLCIYFDI